MYDQSVKLDSSAEELSPTASEPPVLQILRAAANLLLTDAAWGYMRQNAKGKSLDL